MALDFLRFGHLTLSGPALPEPFVRFELERALTKLRLLPDSTGLSGQKVGDEWRVFQRKIRDISASPSPGAIAGQVAAIKTLLGLRRVITNADVQEHLKCDPATARAVLKQLVESGSAVVEGKAKGTKYRMARKA